MEVCSFSRWSAVVTDGFVLLSFCKLTVALNATNQPVSTDWKYERPHTSISVVLQLFLKKEIKNTKFHFVATFKYIPNKE